MALYEYDSQLWLILITVASVVPWIMVTTIYGRRLGIEVLDCASIDNLKEPLVSAWTNTALVSALILTVAWSMVMSDIEITGVVDDEDGAELFSNAYLMLSFESAILACTAVARCVLYLMTVTPLSNTDAVKYCLYGPNTIAGPLLDTVFSLIYMLLALATWIVLKFGLVTGVLTLVMSFLILLMLCLDFADKLCFDPKQQEDWETENKTSIMWRWPGVEDKKKWPKNRRAGIDQKTRGVYNRMYDYIVSVDTHKESQRLPARKLIDASLGTARVTTNEGNI